MDFIILQELQKHGIPDIVMALVGNKADLHEKREVPVQVSSLQANWPITHTHILKFYPRICIYFLYLLMFMGS